MVTEVIDEGAAPEPGQREFRVLEFAEFPGGVCFPVHIEGRIVVKGEVQTIMSMRFSEMRINEPVPDSEFRLGILHGSWVYDNIRGTRYQVDESGGRISEETPLERIVAVAAPEEQIRGIQPPSRPTLEEEKGLWAYFSLGSGGLLLVLLSIWLWQRRRA
ncbi:MAG TPA: hypothetical protein PKD86_14420 [Gemmatales bacterium]|nr:hypothetical protein [Gemmatales bacterium]HMP60538.1 hypothetical protein [Gemmatales bacterium]